MEAPVLHDVDEEADRLQFVGQKVPQALTIGQLRQLRVRVEPLVGRACLLVLALG